MKYIFTKNRGNKRGLEDNIELINSCFPHSIPCFIQNKKYLYKAKKCHIYFFFQSEDMYSPSQLSANEIGSDKNIHRLHLSENVHLWGGIKSHWNICQWSWRVQGQRRKKESRWYRWWLQGFLQLAEEVYQYCVDCSQWKKIWLSSSSWCSMILSFTWCFIFCSSCLYWFLFSIP